MDFTVKFRNRANGSIVQECWTADDRKDLFQKLSEKGISAISVKEGFVVPAKHGLNHRISIVAGVLLVLVGLVFLFINLDQNNEQDKSDISSSPSLISEVKPQIATPDSPVQDKEAESKPDPKPYQDSHGNWWIGDHKPYTDPNKKVVSVNLTTRNIEQRLFKRTCDIRIAQLLLVNPGDFTTEHLDYGDDFNRELGESIFENFEDNPEDTEEDKNLKKAVAEAKKDLYARVRAGEDAAQIMTATRAELERLGWVKKNLQNDLIELSADGDLNDEEADQMIEKANAILAEKGIDPISESRLLKIQMKYKAKNIEK